MKWKTKISTHKDGELYLRGYKLTDLIEKISFAQAAFLALQGRMPSKKEEKIFNALLVAGVEHGVEAPSAFVPRVAVSSGNSVNAALAAGMLGIGDWHGGAIEAAMYIFSLEKKPTALVADARKKGERIPGYGHKIYKDADPRAAALFRLAKKLEFGKKYLARARAIEKELATASGKKTSATSLAKKLPLNIDGAMAALLLELGFDPRLGKAFFAFARMPGMMAHIQEEMTDEKPYRRFSEEDVEYNGPKLRS